MSYALVVVHALIQTRAIPMLPDRTLLLCLTCEFLLFLFLVRACEWTNTAGIRFSKWTVLQICRPQAHITHAPLDNV